MREKKPGRMGMKRVELALLAFLLAGCGAETKKEVAVVTLPDQDSAGAQILISDCTECHGAPQPSAHPAGEWAGVVRRMQNWRTTKGFGVIPEKDEAVLIRYLQEHSRQ